MSEPLAEVERLRAENAEYVRAHELMVAQFKTMQREKEHGWRVAERWEAKAERLRAQIAAIRALADEYWGRATEATSLSPSWRSVCRDIRAALDGGAA